MAPSPTDHIVNYHRPYHLPPLAGLATFEQAVQPGLSVDESVQRIKRHHYALRRLHHLLLARLTAEPIYELKMAFSLHAHYFAEHITALRTRVMEMREPPYGLEDIPHPALPFLFDEILNTPSTAELLLGVYEVVLPSLVGGLQAHSEAAHVMADAPTRRVLRFATLELMDILEWGQAALKDFIQPQERVAAQHFWQTVYGALNAAGGIDGTAALSDELPPPCYSNQPFVYNRTPRRDERFSDPYNMGVNAEAFLYDAAMPTEPKVLMMYYKRLREIDVPEMMASILTDTPDKPWEYYRDMTRQLWDEARHAMLGEIGFVSLGIDWPVQVMINFTWSLELNTRLSAKERHGVLYYIEQGLMPRTGKRFEWETSVQAHNPLSATIQDFDWADEVLHARIGREWYVSQWKSHQEAIRYGDECWSKILGSWAKWREQGLTQHRNWWPELYTAYCAQRELEPEANVLAFDTTYETARADLKTLIGSA